MKLQIIEISQKTHKVTGGRHLYLVATNEKLQQEIQVLNPEIWDRVTVGDTIEIKIELVKASKAGVKA